MSERGPDRSRGATAWRTLRRPWLLALIALAGWAASGLYVIDKVEHGVLVRFGRVVEERVPPGLHYRAPWPITDIERVDTTTSHTMSVGFRIRDMVQGVPTPPEQSRWLTGDTNIIELRVVIQYRATDPAAYRLTADEPDLLVRHAGEAVITDLIGHAGVDETLTFGRGELVSRSMPRIQQQLDDWGCGITVTSVSFEGIDPPREVVDAFHEVQSAKADRHRKRQEAEAYANSVLPSARGDAARLLADARADRQRRIASATGWAGRFEQLSAAHRAAPRATRDRLYLEAVERVLGRGELVVVAPDGPGETGHTVVVQPSPTPR